MKWLLAVVGIYVLAAMISALFVYYFGGGIRCDVAHNIAWMGAVSAVINIVKFMQELNKD